LKKAVEGGFPLRGLLRVQINQLVDQIIRGIDELVETARFAHGSSLFTSKGLRSREKLSGLLLLAPLGEPEGLGKPIERWRFW
jgi:hypothetical protein